MRTPTSIFTYGTLMSTATCDVGRAERAAMGRCARLNGPASLRGRMYDVGLYPAAVPTPLALSWIYGEIWQLPPDNDDLLAMLDRYEGCGPGCDPVPPYRRTRVSVRTRDGRRVRTWMYVWNRSTSGLMPIPDGRWRAPNDASGRIDILRRPQPARLISQARGPSAPAGAGMVDGPPVPRWLQAGQR
jgi:gamma-glutamylcyclotransferase (GGCT)/AIG2-like uncharacterized protein YtfP